MRGWVGREQGLHFINAVVSIPPFMRLLAITVFLSSFLLFQIEPLIGKYILPWFGGAPQVWTACMLFFQLALLAGYAYTHFLVKVLVIKWQVIVHISMLIVTLLWLPVTPPEFLKPDHVEQPVMHVLLVLLVSVGGPFLLISSTAPLLQSWFSRAFPGRSPYRLYALSNAGSLLGLFAYPFIVERLFRLSSQTWGWSAGYLCFVVLCTVTGGWILRRVGKTKIEDMPPHECSELPEGVPFNGRKRKFFDMFLWVALSFIGSVMFLATTNQVCQNVAAVPFLWVMPLGIYLFSFILCFDGTGWYRGGIFAPLWLVTLGMGMWLGFGASVPVIAQIVIYGLILFICCMVCHGELARLKPKPSQLTLFFFMVSLGGLLGGVFVSLVAPVIFTLYYEFYVGLIGTGLVLVLVLRRDHWQVLEGGALRRNMIGTVTAVVAVVLLVAGASKLVNWSGLRGGANTIAVYRDFYGIVSVQREQTPKSGHTLLAFTHGNTTHGFQFEDEDKRSKPNGYYEEESGIGLALRHHPKRLKGEPLRVGVIGLGAGALAAYAQPGDDFQFYELDPKVEWFARQFFTYLYDAEERGATTEVYLGDGRIMLERQLKQEGGRQFDILVLDAFSSDAVPVHLLTEDAFALYQKHLRPDGILAAHISNRYLDLAPVVRSSAKGIGLDAVQIWNLAPNSADLPEKFRMHSHWILITDNRDFLNQPEVKNALTPWGKNEKLIPWTDHFSSLFQVLQTN
jgi:hypothetical protein